MQLDTDVMVVGAGPVGLTAALALSRAGVSVDVIEALPEPSTEWRASTFHPPTLEIGRELEVIAEMLRRGLVAPRYQIRERGVGLVAKFDFGRLAGETPYPFRLQLEQYKYVQILEEALQELPTPVPVRYGQRATGVEDEGPDAVRLHLAGGQSMTARYVVAADGASSTLRDCLGVGFDGSTYRHRYLVLSIDAPLDELLPDICDVNYVADPDEHLLLLRVPDVWRVVLSVHPDVDDDEAVSDEYVAARLRLLVNQPTALDVVARNVYKVHQRVADAFRAGRTLMVGDAAHINSPMGGMGLNSGIHDAYDLATQLQAVLVHGAGEERLDEWAERRRRVALEEIQRLTHDATEGLGSNSDRQVEFLASVAAIAGDPPAAHAWMLEASMIDNVRRHGLPGRAAMSA